MRKFTAVVLAVLMLVSVLAVLPVSAATPTTYDGTTKDTAGLNQIFISEVAPVTRWKPANVTKAQYDTCFNFVELYNNSANSIDLSTLSLLRAVRIPFEPDDDTDPYFTNVRNNKRLWEIWNEDYKFISKIDIKTGKIVDDATAKLTNVFTDANPATPEIDDDPCFNYLTNAGVDMNLASGKNAVLWFVGPATMDWIKAQQIQDATFDPKTAFVKYFYGENAALSDYTVIMVWGWSDRDLSDPDKIATDMFSISSLPEFDNKNCDYILGIAKNTWDLEEDAAYDATATTINSDLYSMTVLGSSVPSYNFSTANSNKIVDVSATFAPSTSKPYVANAIEALAAIGTPTVFADYFAAGYITSYRETGVIDWNSVTTPGTMPTWQWAMIDPANANAPAELKTNGEADATKVQAVVDAYLQERQLIDDGTGSGREEDDDRDYNFQLQEDLKNQFFGKKDEVEEEEGFPLVALILIIVGSVLVVAGGACAVIFLVVLPKKKAAAAAAVAAEAPVEDAPAAEATPVEEEKKDE